MSERQHSRDMLRQYNEESRHMTRECIETALVLLMRERPYAEITITDVIRRSGVSRSAFYRNYSTKEEVLSTVFGKAVDLIVSLISVPLRANDPRGCYSILFREMQSQWELFEIITRANLEKALITGINERLLRALNPQDTRARIKVLSWVGSTMNVLLDWFRNGMKVPAEDMARLCSESRNETDYGMARTVLGLGKEA